MIRTAGLVEVMRVSCSAAVATWFESVTAPPRSMPPEGSRGRLQHVGSGGTDADAADTMWLDRSDSNHDP